MRMRFLIFLLLPLSLAGQNPNSVFRGTALPGPASVSDFPEADFSLQVYFNSLANVGADSLQVGDLLLDGDCRPFTVLNISAAAAGNPALVTLDVRDDLAEGYPPAGLGMIVNPKADGLIGIVNGAPDAVNDCASWYDRQKTQEALDGIMPFDTAYVDSLHALDLDLDPTNELFDPTYIEDSLTDIRTDLSAVWADMANDVEGSGTSGYLARWTGSGTLGNSLIQDNGTRVAIGTTPQLADFYVRSSSTVAGYPTALFDNAVAAAPYAFAFGQAGRPYKFGWLLENTNTLTEWRARLNYYTLSTGAIQKTLMDITPTSVGLSGVTILNQEAIYYTPSIAQPAFRIFSGEHFQFTVDDNNSTDAAYLAVRDNSFGEFFRVSPYYAKLPKSSTLNLPVGEEGMWVDNTDSLAFQGYHSSAWRTYATRDWVRSTYGVSGYAGWTIAADLGSADAIGSGETLTLSGGEGIAVENLGSNQTQISWAGVQTGYGLSGLGTAASPLEADTTSVNGLATQYDLLQIDLSSYATQTALEDTAAAIRADMSVADALDDLTDVTISAPVNRQVLRYTGANWVNSAPEWNDDFTTLTALRNITTTRNAANVHRIESYTNGTTMNVFRGFGARGTTSSPSRLTAGTVITKWGGWPFGAVQDMASIDFVAQGAHFDGSYSTAIDFNTARFNDRYRVMRLDSLGGLTLDWYGDGTFAGTASRFAALDADGKLIERLPSTMYEGFTSQLQLPSGTTAQRLVGTAGQIRNNTDSTAVEGYHAGAWYTYATRSWVRNNTTARGSTTATDSDPDASTLLGSYTESFLVVETTSGATSASQVLLPSPSVTYANKRLTVISVDSSGSHNAEFSAGIGEIYDGSTYTNTATIFGTVSVMCLPKPGGGYAWYIQ